jgi:DNA polymerase IIIc chi subunit
MNETSLQSIPPSVPRGIIDNIDGRRRHAVFYFCNSRPGAAVIGQLLDTVIVRASRRALVLTRSASAATLLSKGLWAFRRNSFIPHGVDGANAHLQPALITAVPYNANDADVLVLPDGESLRNFAPDAASGNAGDFLARFPLILLLMDTRDDAAMHSAAQSWNDALALGYETSAFEREVPASVRRVASAASSDFESPVPLRWHRLA